MEEEKQTPHITNVFFKFVTKVLTSVVRDRHQVIQLASWDTPHHPLGLSPKNDGKNNATEPWDPEPMGKGFEERIIACHKKPWLKTIISTISIHPSAMCSSYQNWSSFARCDSFYSLYSPHIPTQILVKRGRFWDERSAGKAKKFTGNQRLHDCLRLWQLDLVAQWQREKNTLCRKTLIFSTYDSWNIYIMICMYVRIHCTLSHCRDWHSVSLVLLCFGKRRWQALTNRPGFRHL